MNRLTFRLNIGVGYGISKGNLNYLLRVDRDKILVVDQIDNTRDADDRSSLLFIL